VAGPAAFDELAAYAVAGVPVAVPPIRSPRAIACMRAEMSAGPAATRTGLAVDADTDVWMIPETRPSPAAGVSPVAAADAPLAAFVADVAAPAPARSELTD
jgi:hypothetical protein